MILSGLLYRPPYYPVCLCDDHVQVVLDANVARILLGTALLFQAAVILRYINYFKQVNVSHTYIPLME